MGDTVWDMVPTTPLSQALSMFITLPLKNKHLFLVPNALMESHKDVWNLKQLRPGLLYVLYVWVAVSIVSRSPYWSFKAKGQEAKLDTQNISPRRVCKDATEVNSTMYHHWYWHKWWGLALQLSQLCTLWMRPIQTQAQTHIKASLFWQHGVIHSRAQKPLWRP